MKLVLFDLDGTLLNAKHQGLPSMAKTMQDLYGKKVTLNAADFTSMTDKHNLTLTYKTAFKKAPTAPQLATMKAAYYKNLKAEVAATVKAKKCRPVKGVEALLKKLANAPGVKTALCTGNLKEAAKIKLAPFNLGKYFATGGFGDDVLDRISLIKSAIKNAQKFYKTKFAPDDIFVVGDTHIDIIAAKELGLHNAAVLEAKLGDAQKLLRAAAELETQDFTDKSLWFMWLRLQEDPKGVEKGSYIMPASAIEHVFFSRTGIDEQRLKMFRIKKYSDLESGKLI